MSLSFLFLVCHSTQEANIGDYASYNLTEEAYCRIVATDLVDRINFAMPSDKVRAVLVNPIASDAGKAAQSVGDLMAKVNSLYEQYRKSDPGVVVLVLDIHTDAGGATGTSGLYYSTAGRDWIEYIYNEVAKVSPGKDHGLRFRNDLGILVGTKPVAGLIELAPHDRASSTAHLVNNPLAYSRACAVGMGKAIGVAYPPEGAPTPTPEVVQESLAEILNRIKADVDKALALTN